MVRFTLDGEKYQFDKMMLAEARQVKKWTGFTPETFGPALFALDPDALTALILIQQKRQGRYLVPNAFDTFDADLSTLEVEFVDEQGRKVEPKQDDDGNDVLGDDGRPVILHDGQELPAEEDPTGPASVASTPRKTKTSESTA